MHLENDFLCDIIVAKENARGADLDTFVFGAVLSVSRTLLVLAIGTIRVQAYMSCDAALAMGLADKHDIE